MRANAFHLNAHSGLVRLVHFGNRAVSLEQFGVPSTFVLRSDAFEEAKKLKVKEALCYLGTLNVTYPTCQSSLSERMEQPLSRPAAWSRQQKIKGQTCTR